MTLIEQNAKWVFEKEECERLEYQMSHIYFNSYFDSKLVVNWSPGLNLRCGVCMMINLNSYIVLQRDRTERFWNS